MREISGTRLLDGHVAAVTGAGRGIGRAIALGLAVGGAHVAALGRSRSQLDETVALVGETGTAGAAFSADLTDPESVIEVFDEIARTLGPIDLLVNNAGVLGPIGPFSETDPDVWWAAVNGNLRVPALCARAVLPSMIGRRCGRIVNVSSGGAASLPIAYLSSYVVAKTALVRLTECLAIEARPYGVSVFAIGPGTVRTAMSEHSLSSADGRRWIPWFQRIFDERFDVDAERAATLVVALASGRGDALTGRFLTISDPIDEIVRRAAEVDRGGLYALRVGRLAEEPPPAALRSILDAATRPAGLTLRVHRAIDAPPDRVFAAWIDPAAVADWFVHGADVRWIDRPVIDARPGGRFRLCVAGSSGVFEFRGAYRDVTAASRLAFTWRWESIPILDAPGDTSVTIDLVEKGARTELTLVQEHLADRAAFDAHERGWLRCLDGIVRLVEEPA